VPELARRPAVARAPANDGGTYTAGAARRLNCAQLGKQGAAGPKANRSTDLQSQATTLLDNNSGGLTPELSGRTMPPRK
jgi:hypothetical protein